ncbi:MAG: NAD+ synthase [Verrucomicrobia bacterium]|nr:NAD+ synthase [Verrucomicrobiota bacterium]
MMPLRLALAQINTTVGDLAGNRAKIIARLNDARAAGVDLVVFPELAITGYPPEDLLLKPDFVRAASQSLNEIVSATRGLTAIIGCVHVEDDLFNAAAIAHDGQLVGLYKKQFLPNYGVFDENRYFGAGQQKQVFSRNGSVFGVSVCEDIWYPNGPYEGQAALGGAELLINLSASPYHLGKGVTRERMIAARASDNTAFVAYCNLVGGQDELIFDGQSLICGPQGELLARGKQFEEDFIIADLDFRQVFRARLSDPRRRKRTSAAVADYEKISLRALPTPAKARSTTSIATPLERVAEVYQALVLGTRDYVHKNGFQKVVLGLSGGIDSALTAAIAADALGANNVTGVAMPTRYSSSHSLEDAEQLAGSLGIEFLKVPIDKTFQSFLDLLKPVFGARPTDLTEENLQPRVRGTILMALSNKFGSLVLTTSNKSESAVGYSTLYGDTAGGFAVIKDVPKLLVYELSRYRNSIAGREIIPARTIEKPPSAELRPDQKDSDSLPEYDVLDPILCDYVEANRGFEEIVARCGDPDSVRRVIRLVDRNEYKRRQSPPGVKITSRAFGKDWRLPITNRYQSAFE